MARRKSILVILSILFIAAGCEKEDSSTEKTEVEIQKTPKIDAGVIEDGLYRNQYFDFSLKLPEGWHVQSEIIYKKVLKKGSRVMAGDDKALKASIDDRIKNFVMLFTLSEYLLGAPVEFNPTIIALIDNVSEWPGIKKPEDYLFHVKRTTSMGQLNYEFSGESETVNISGQDFGMMPVILHLGKIQVKQKMYALLKDGYVLLITTAYVNEQQGAVMDELVRSIQFGSSGQANSEP